jgi:hypothetical protein
MTKKTIVILANSVKHGNHCVAGKCTMTKSWIRPVSDISGAELTNDQSKYKNPHGEFTVKPKQKIEMLFSQHAPLLNQPENYLISNVKWEQRFRIEDNELEEYLDHPTSLWGVGDRVQYEDIENGNTTIEQSLYLVKVEDLRLSKPNNHRRAEFSYNGMQYSLAATDPNFDKFLNEECGFQGILCISLGENFRGSCYKLVATIF